MDVRDVVSEAYISFLVVEESTNILDSTMTVMTQMVDELRKYTKPA